jgi:radical SAM family uncharacterized protein
MMNCDDIQTFLDKNLLKVMKPVAYVGNESNAVVKDWMKTPLSCCLLFPDRYEIGMSNLAVHLFYTLINNRDDMLLERAFLPADDMRLLMKEHDVPLFSLETKHALDQFDVIAFSFPSELNFTNALLALDMSSIALRSVNREEHDPLIIAGGGGVVNPLPMSPFIDVFIIGDGEDSFVMILDDIKTLRAKGYSRETLLKELAENEHYYVPQFHDGRQTVKRSYLKKFEDKHLILKPIIPLLNVVHNRFSIELMRGCPRDCRFCQASYINKPVRLKKPDSLVAQTKKVIENSGYEEISLSSLSSSDYPYINRLTGDLNEVAQEKNISLSLPSLRIDTFSDELSAVVNKMKQSGVTLAPEAGSQFLRDVIKKNISEEQIMKTVIMASKNSKKGIKLYFMIGLPRETDDDIQALVDLVYTLIDAIKPARNKLIVNVSNFVPKPFTPFQWVPQASSEVLDAKLQFLKQKLRHRQVELRWTDSDLSELEGLLSRGDKSVGDLIELAYKKGAMFDAWYDHFKYEYWKDAMEELSIDKATILGVKQEEDQLDWDFIDVGMKKDRLLKEYLLSTKVDRKNRPEVINQK